MRLLKYVLLSALLVGSVPGLAWCENSLVERFLNSRRVVSTVYFDDNSYLINDKYQKQLELLIDVLKEEISRGRFVRAEGFASNEGQQIYSFKLSLQRAKSVVEFFEKQENLPEVYLTGYGDLQAKSTNPNDEWRVEIVTYENVVDVSMFNTDRPNIGSQPKPETPISSQSLLNFKQGHMEALSKFDEPLVIDALAIEQALMEKLGNTPARPGAAVSQIDWQGSDTDRDLLEVPLQGEISTQ